MTVLEFVATAEMNGMQAKAIVMHGLRCVVRVKAMWNVTVTWLLTLKVRNFRKGAKHERTSAKDVHNLQAL
jgi:hypothetical protein